MPERDRLLSFLGLQAGASASEIASAYASRSVDAEERLAAGDESARVELAVLMEAYERLTGRKAVTVSHLSVPRPTAGATTGALAASESAAAGAPNWWEAYLSLLLTLCSATALGLAIAYMPRIYDQGGFLAPGLLLLVGGLLSIAASVTAERELQHGLRRRLLGSRGVSNAQDLALFRWRLAWLSSLISRTVRWLIVLALIAVVLLNFASLSGRWSLRD